jgi:7-carboxy-7-deazaguanine synthase
LRIAEIYESVQGEGKLTGTAGVFVRASGCNLRCWYCDTPYASFQPEGEDMSVDEIVRQVEQIGGNHAVLTGGEPMLFAELIPLCKQLRQRKWHITIETAGTLHLPVDCDLMSISPKLSNSTPSPGAEPKWSARHDRTRHAPDVVRRLVMEYEYQVKFVIDQPADCKEVEDYLTEFPEIDRAQMMLMPQGTEKESLAKIGKWLEPYCRQHGLKYCPRKQIEWFGFARGT